MNASARFIFSTVLLVILSFALQAQTGTNVKVTYQFYLLHIDNKEEGQKLDSAYTKKKGVYSAHTNYETKKVTVVVTGAVDFKALKAIAMQNGFEVSEENVTRTEELIQQ